MLHKRNLASYKCVFPSCILPFEGAQALREHLKCHLHTAAVCSKCQIAFANSEDFLQHFHCSEHKRSRSSTNSNSVWEFTDAVPVAILDEAVNNTSQLCSSEIQDDEDLQPDEVVGLSTFDEINVDEDSDDDGVEEAGSEGNLGYVDQFRQFLRFQPAMLVTQDFKKLMTDLVSLQKDENFPYENSDIAEFVRMVREFIFSIGDNAIDNESSVRGIAAANIGLVAQENKFEFTFVCEYNQVTAAPCSKPRKTHCHDCLFFHFLQFHEASVWSQPTKRMRFLHPALVLFRFFNDPELLKQMTFEPADVQSSVQRHYGELWTGDWWHAVSSKLPTDISGNKPKLVVILPEQDKTALNLKGECVTFLHLHSQSIWQAL